MVSARRDYWAVTATPHSVVLPFYANDAEAGTGAANVIDKDIGFQTWP